LTCRYGCNLQRHKASTLLSAVDAMSAIVDCVEKVGIEVVAMI
jgi:hypothetical protein